VSLSLFCDELAQELAQPGLRANWATKMTPNRMGRTMKAKIWQNFEKRNKKKGQKIKRKRKFDKEK